MTTINLNPTQNKVSALKNFFEQKIINQQNTASRTNPVQQQPTQSQSIHTKQVVRSQGAKDLKTNFDGFQFLIDNAETLGIQGIQLENVKKIQAHIKASKDKAVDEHNPELQKLVIAEFKEAREDFIEYVRSGKLKDDIMNDPDSNRRETILNLDSETKPLTNLILERFEEKFNALFEILIKDSEFSTCKHGLYYQKIAELLSFPSLTSDYENIKMSLYESHLPMRMSNYGHEAYVKENYQNKRIVPLYILSKNPDLPFPVFNYGLAEGFTFCATSVGIVNADNQKYDSISMLDHDESHHRVILNLFKDFSPEELDTVFKNLSQTLQAVSFYILALPKEEQKNALILFHLGYFMLTHESSYTKQTLTRTHLLKNILNTMSRFKEKSGLIYKEFKDQIITRNYFPFKNMDVGFAYLDIFEDLKLNHNIDKNKYLNEKNEYESFYFVQFDPDTYERIKHYKNDSIREQAKKDFDKTLDCFVEIMHHMGRIATEAVAWSQNQIN